MKFPIIVLKKNEHFIYYVENEEDISTTTESLLKERFFDHSEFIDSSGYVFLPINAFKLGYTKFWGLNPLLKGWLHDRQIRIKFEYSNEVKQIELRYLKLELIKRVENQRSFWEVAWDVDDLISRIKDAQSFEILIPLFK